MNAMIGSGGGDREIPINPLYDLMESGDITLKYMGIINQDGNESESECYTVDPCTGDIYTMNHNYFHILAVAERN